MPNILMEDLLRLAAELRRENVDYILVGGMALGFQGLVRATQDIDFFVRPDGANVEALKRAVRRAYDDPEVDDIRPTDLDQYNVIRYGPPERDYLVDFIARLGEAFSYDDLVSEEMEMDGVWVRVATPRTLYLMKRDTVRPQDRADALALLEKFHLEEP